MCQFIEGEKNKTIFSLKVLLFGRKFQPFYFYVKSGISIAFLFNMSQSHRNKDPCNGTKFCTKYFITAILKNRIVKFLFQSVEVPAKRCKIEGQQYIGRTMKTTWSWTFGETAEYPATIVCI